MLTVDAEKCIGCGICEDTCAFGAITVNDGLACVGDGCTLCGSCVSACESEALSIEGGEKLIRANLQDWSGVWVFAEQRHGEIATVAYELLGAGRRLADLRGTRLGAVLLGERAEAAQSLIAAGADTVYCACAPELAQFREDVFGRILESLIRQYKPEVVLAGATAIGRSLIPQVANTLGAGLTADCTQLDIRPEDGMLLQTRPAFGGNIMATIECPHSRPQMATVRPRVMLPASIDPARQGEIVPIALTPDMLASRMEIIESVISAQEESSIQESEVLIAGGRGLDRAEAFALLRDLATELGGTVAASRAAVDAGWIGYPCQVGQTGKTVAPKLYIACGISGAIQHAVGMQSAETVVAINRDSSAPIFDLATYGLVGDLFEIIPLLTRKIRESRGL